MMIFEGIRRYKALLLLQIGAVVVLLVLLTVMRFVFNDTFLEVKRLYDEHFNTEISISLVLDGD